MGSRLSDENQHQDEGVDPRELLKSVNDLETENRDEI
jgi:hypothetical protein